MGFAWGEETPDAGEEPASWQLWQETLGVPLTVQGDQDWGKAEVPTGTPVYGAVVNYGSSIQRTWTVTKDKYEAGSGDVTIRIRGSSTSFDQHDGTPSWSVYSGPTQQTWQYVQLRMDYL